MQIEAFRQHPECGVFYGKTRYLAPSTENSLVAWKRTGERIETMFPLFLESRWWGTSTPLYRSGITDRAGAWLSLRNEEDWEYDCRIAKLGVRLAYCPEFVSVEREHSGPRLSPNGTAHRKALKSR